MRVLKPSFFPRLWGNNQSLTMGDGNCPLCGEDLDPTSLRLDGICTPCFINRVDNRFLDAVDSSENWVDDSIISP